MELRSTLIACLPARILRPAGLAAVRLSAFIIPVFSGLRSIRLRRGGSAEIRVVIILTIPLPSYFAPSFPQIILRMSFIRIRNNGIKSTDEFLHRLDSTSLLDFGINQFQAMVLLLTFF
jgi:hypothetical protein